MLLEGQQIGRYSLQQLLGSGGMGEVYLAEDAAIRRQVAVKVMRTGSAAYPESEAGNDAVRLFQREMKAIARLDHPHILPLFDYGEESIGKMTITYMVMPYRREGSLADWLQQQKLAMLTPQEVGHMVLQAAKALQYAHGQQIIHQDVKPSNFLVRSVEDQPTQPDLLLADFGVARFTSATTSMSHTIRGTPSYMAPEQWQGQAVPATDQYALAILAYQLLVGHPPFNGNIGQMMYQHLNVQAEPPSKSNPQVQKDIDDVLLLALAKKPTERFASVTAFANAFQQALHGAETAAVAVATAKSEPVESETLHATLAISPQEAMRGSQRLLNLPGGRRVPITVPAYAQDGQVLTLEAGSDETGVKPYTVIVTIAITVPEEAQPSQGEEKTFLSNRPHMELRPTVISSPVAKKAPPRRTRTRGILTVVGGLLVVIILLESLGLYFFTATATSPNPYALSGSLALDDSLSGNIFDTLTWFQGTTSQGSCEFIGGAFHSSQSVSGASNFCTNGASSLNNFAYEVRMTIAHGDFGGIVFRCDNTAANCYYFRIGQDGSYELDVVKNGSFQQLTSGTSNVINPGVSLPNEIAVVANGSKLDLFVNFQRIASVNDSTYTGGRIGVAASSVGNQTDVAFNDAEVWSM